MKPILTKWLSTADERYCFLAVNGTLQPIAYNKFVVGNANASAGKRRRQKRKTFSETDLKKLNQEFQENPLPNVFRLEELAKELGIEYKRIKVWFCNKRQTVKNEMAKNGSGDIGSGDR